MTKKENGYVKVNKTMQKWNRVSWIKLIVLHIGNLLVLKIKKLLLINTKLVFKILDKPTKVFLIELKLNLKLPNNNTMLEKLQCKKTLNLLLKRLPLSSAVMFPASKNVENKTMETVSHNAIVAKEPSQSKKLTSTPSALLRMNMVTSKT